MSEDILLGVLQALRLVVFQRDEQQCLRLLGSAPDWLAGLWPVVVEKGILLPELSPFLENFLVDAAQGWEGTEVRRTSSGPWVESTPRGGEHYLQAHAFRVSDRAILLLEELGSAYEERTSILQKAHEAALAYADRLRGMYEIDKAILSAQSPEAIAQAALRRLYPLLPCEHASVVMFDANSGSALILASATAGQIESGKRLQLSKQQLEQARVLTSGQLHLIRDAANLFEVHAAGSSEAQERWPLIIDAPLMAEETLIGVLNLATRSPALFMAEHEELVREVALHLAVGLRQARMFAQISTGREQLRALSLRLVEVQEAERRFLAHELHDEIGQVLTGLKLTLELPAQTSGQTQPTHVSEAIGMVDDLMHRVRQLSLDLRPQVLDDLGLMSALDWLFKRYYKQTGIRVQFKHTSLAGRLGTQLETAAFRIVQEALTNIARHSGVKEATVRLWSDGHRLGLQVEDKGSGFIVEHVLTAGTSSGVAGMRERALVLGGEFTLDSAPGTGTRLTVELPLNSTATFGAKSEGGG